MTQEGPFPFRFATDKSVAAYKWDRFFWLAGETQTNLMGCFGVGHVVAPVQEAFFNP